MKKLVAAMVAIGFVGAGVAHAFSVPPLSKAQQKIAKKEIQTKLPAGSQIKSIKFGFGPTPVGFIGSGFEHATVRVKEGSSTKTLNYTVSPGLNGGVNILNP
jgi:hypothetical protein